MSRPAVAIIDLEAIKHNYQIARAQAPAAKAVAIVKANGYGHGAVQVARALDPEADAFGVACIEEAQELRESGISSPILLLEGIFTADELPLVERHELPMTVHSQQQLTWLLDYRAQSVLKIFLKIDTGMHRLGFSPEEVPRIFTELKKCPHVGEIVLMTHFARADESERTYTAQQLTQFHSAIKGLNVQTSFANSPATLSLPDAGESQWLRPGIMLYGASPLERGNSVSSSLIPAMSLRSEIISVRTIEAGETIGYGGRFVCNKKTRVGVVALGYADGYPRHAPDGTPVLVAGKRSQVIGRVSMDMLTVDLTDIPQADYGSEVELWGKNVLANEVAMASETIAYELFTGVTRRVHFQYF